MEVSSVQDFLSIIEKLEKNYTVSIPNGNQTLNIPTTYTPRFIFRGHGNHADYKLIPGAFRWKQLADGRLVGECSQMEYNILRDFISEACRYVHNIPTNDIPAWLEVAQHFGVPTRLLDFTQSALVALYFACSDLKNTDASVWIINEEAYNRVFFDERSLIHASQSQLAVQSIVNNEVIRDDWKPHDDPDEFYQYPWIYKPIYHEERMNMQASVFMLWAAQRYELTHFMKPEYYMLPDDSISNQMTGVIGCIVIPADKKRVILDQLNALNINEKFIYPGLDGVGRYIKAKYSSKLL